MPPAWLPILFIPKAESLNLEECAILKENTLSDIMGRGPSDLEHHSAKVPTKSA